MDNTRPIILITNDDSIEAPGLHALVDIAKDFGDIYVVAPVSPRSGQSAAITVGALFYGRRHAGRLCEARSARNCAPQARFSFFGYKPWF